MVWGPSFILSTHSKGALSPDRMSFSGFCIGLTSMIAAVTQKTRGSGNACNALNLDKNGAATNAAVAVGCRHSRMGVFVQPEAPEALKLR